MIEYSDLLDILFGTGQIFCMVLLLFGAYLSTLKPAFLVNRSDEGKQQPSASLIIIRIASNSPQMRQET
jgi:hypothetical protein